MQTLKGHGSFVYSVAWSPYGKWLASGSNDETIKIWKTLLPQEILNEVFNLLVVQANSALKALKNEELNNLELLLLGTLSNKLKEFITAETNLEIPKINLPEELQSEVPGLIVRQADVFIKVFKKQNLSGDDQEMINSLPFNLKVFLADID